MNVNDLDERTGNSFSTPRLSIVIPAYQAEGTIQRAVESILAWRHDSIFQNDVEIIVINDGSTDGTEKIIKELSSRYSWLRLVSQTNKGRSAARNSGIALARGSWIMFLDADDFLLPDTYKVIENAMSTNNAEIIFPMTMSKTSRTVGRSKYSLEELLGHPDRFKDKNLSASELRRFMISPEDIQQSNEAKSQLQMYELNACWGRIYKRDCLFNRQTDSPIVLFPEGLRMSEDRLFNLSLLSKYPAGTISLKTMPLYYWDLSSSNTVSRITAKGLENVLHYDGYLSYMVKDGILSEEEATKERALEIWNQFKNSANSDDDEVSKILNFWSRFFSLRANRKLLKKVSLPIKKSTPVLFVIRGLLRSGLTKESYLLLRAAARLKL